MDNLFHLKNGGPSSTHLRQIRGAASVSLPCPFREVGDAERELRHVSRSALCETSPSLACSDTVRTRPSTVRLMTHVGLVVVGAHLLSLALLQLQAFEVSRTPPQDIPTWNVPGSAWSTSASAGSIWFSRSGTSSDGCNVLRLTTHVVHREIKGPGGPLPEGWGPKAGGPKFRSFFPSPAPIFALFLSLWRSSRGILVVFQAPGPSNVHVWSSL